MKVVTFHITTATGGAYTSSPSTVTGQPSSGAYLLHKVVWVDGTLADGVDAVLSVTNTPSGVDTTLLTLTNANNDADYYPRELEDDNTGTATTFYTLPVVDGTLKLAVTNGGDAKTGLCLVYLMEA